MGTYQQEGPSGSDQAQRLLTFGLLAATITAAPKIDGLEELILRVIEYTFSLAAAALFGILGYIFSAATSTFLFFPPPGKLPSLRSLWFDTAGLFAGIVVVGGLAYILMFMLFSEDEKADLSRLLSRLGAAVLAMILTSPALTFEIPHPDGGSTQVLDLFSIIILVHNGVGQAIFPDAFTLAVLPGTFNSMMGGIAAAGAGIVTVIGLFLISWKIVVGILLVVLTFWVMLIMRMIIVYTVYAMMPVLLGLWVFDFGPFKYGALVSELTWKITALLLLQGILISGIMATTGAVAGSGVDSNLGFLDKQYDEAPEPLYNEDGSMNQNVTGGNNGNTSASVTAGGSAASSPPGGVTLMVMKMLFVLGGPTASIAITVSGLSIFMPNSGNLSSRMRQGRNPKGRLASTGSMSGQGSGAGMAGTNAAITQDGETVFVNTDEGGVTLSDDSINTFNNGPPEEVPLTEKAKNIAPDGLMERMPNMDKTPVRRGIKEAGNLGVRGGKAYYQVFKQPPGAQSVNEALRIGRASPIGKESWGGGESSQPSPRPDEGAAVSEGQAETPVDDPTGLASSEQASAATTEGAPPEDTSIGDILHAQDGYAGETVNIDHLELQSPNVGSDKFVDPNSGMSLPINEENKIWQNADVPSDDYSVSNLKIIKPDGSDQLQAEFTSNTTFHPPKKEADPFYEG